MIGDVEDDQERQSSDTVLRYREIEACENIFTLSIYIPNWGLNILQQLINN